MEGVNNMPCIRRCADRRNGFCFRYIARGGQNSRTAEAVSDQDGWRFIIAPKKIHRSQEILDIGRKIRVCEIAAAHAEAGEIEPQHADALCRQRRRYPRRGENIFRAGKAMRENRIGFRRAGRQFEACRQHVALRTFKSDLR